MDYKAEKIMPYGKKESKTQQVREMFDSIAPVYDFMNRAMTFGIDKLWRRKAVGFLRRKGVQSLLDVATGTGDFAMLLCRKLHPKRLVGVDLSENMLSIAQQKAQRAGLDDVIEYAKGDCLALDFSDGEFDAVTVAYGVRNSSISSRDMPRCIVCSVREARFVSSSCRRLAIRWCSGFIGSIRAGLSRCLDAASRRMPVPIPICRRA